MDESEQVPRAVSLPPDYPTLLANEDWRFLRLIAVVELMRWCFSPSAFEKLESLRDGKGSLEVVVDWPPDCEPFNEVAAAANKAWALMGEAVVTVRTSLDIDPRPFHQRDREDGEPYLFVESPVSGLIQNLRKAS